MALFRCIDCKKKISDRVLFCPNCGCPVNDEVVSIAKNLVELKRKTEEQIKELEGQIKKEKEELSKKIKIRRMLKKQLREVAFPLPFKSIIHIKIICIIILLFGFILLLNDNFKLRIMSTTGAVTGTQIKYNADGVLESRDITLSYIANNLQYNVNIENYSNEINIGDRITLYYDLFLPENANLKMSISNGYLILIIGFVLSIYCIKFQINIKKNIKKVYF